MANAIERLLAFLLIVVLQRIRFFAVRKILVSIFDRFCNGGALREICDLAGGFTGGNLRSSTTKKIVKT
ncbi:hypothetical protein EDY01_21995 [Salmonella enterica]|nr:hypothetical protein [Salmonella enterica]